MEAVQLDQLQQRHEHGDDLLAGVVRREQLEEAAAPLPHPAGDAGHAAGDGVGVPPDLPAGKSSDTSSHSFLNHHRQVGEDQELKQEHLNAEVA